MTGRPGGFGLEPDAKARLLGQLAGKAVQPRAPAVSSPLERPPLGDPDALKEAGIVAEIGALLGIENPFFRAYSGLPTPFAEVEGRTVSNFASYNYLGLNGHPRVSQAAKAAIDRYGTSVSGSRIMSGERPVHRALEAALAGVYRAEDCVTFVSGHAANVTTIAHLTGPEDAVVYDALAHNSIVQGAILSGARRRSFAHNDPDELERALHQVRSQARRILVVVEGCYSMDGDVPDLPRMAAIVRRYGAYLMVDEAHALGVLGATGRGAAEHFDMDPALVDLWMGTLSKTLASCGGYIAGGGAVVEHLRGSAPGFLFSVGMPAPVAAAALAALETMLDEPERVARLHANGQVFLQAVKAAGLDSGAAIGEAVIPVIIGSSLRTALTADALWKAGVNVQPIHYPGVPERTARLRFFITSEHEPQELRRVAALTAERLAAVQVDPALIAELAAKLGS
ncbi:MAG: 8-amino-7-oxononanoate synthase [Caulobacterales bacterium 32-69-10]|nr:MAG: 8-amino-7-oxononanoate synthase [Caulobacterales bacterium 32-69-10]